MTQTEETGKPESGKGSMPMFEISRKILLAAIGAMALAQDEIEDFVSRLVERGEIAEKEGKSLVSEMREKRKQSAQEVEERASKKIQETLERMHVPTRKDIEELSEKIATLSKKLDELKK